MLLDIEKLDDDEYMEEDNPAVKATKPSQAKKKAVKGSKQQGTKAQNALPS